MSRTSPVHYIAPSAISIIPNANGSANDIAVHIASGTKIKVYCRTLGIDMVNATFQEWAIAGKNRRLANENVPYTIYARLPKTDKSKGYLIFAPKLQVDDKWTDKYCYITPNGMSSEGTADDSNWYVKIGDVSEVDNAQRILDLDTGILGTDQYNSEWNLNPDDFPLRVEIDCTINDEPAGSYPYVRWSEQVRLSARLLQGFAAATDLSQVDHWGIYKNLGEQAPELAPTPDWPDAQRKELFQTTGDIALYHSRDGVDDFDGAEACIFTVVAWGAPADATELDGGNPSYVQKAIATVTLHAETYEVLSSEDIPDDQEEFVPSDTTLFTGAAMDAYMKRYPHYFRKDQPDTDPHLASFGDLHVKKNLPTDPDDPTALSGGNMLVEGDAEFEKDVQTHGNTRLSTNGGSTTIGGTATIAGTTTIGNFREHTEIQEGSGAQVAEDGSAKFYGRESRMRTVIFGNYEPGMIAGAAHGAKIEESGDGRFKSMSISEFLEVPEIRFNRATVYIGIGIRSVGGGIIEEVIPEQEGGVIIAAGRASVKLEDGEYGALDLADKMLGFWHNEGLPGQATGNADADRDDRNGDYELKGFQSVYFRIDGFYANEQDFKAGTNVIQDEVTPRGANKYFHYSLRTTGVHGWTLRHHPHQGMHFGLIANDRNTARQSLFITTTEYELSLQNLTDWNYDSSNITKIDGKLDGFSMPSQRWNDQTQQYETYLKPFFGNGTVLGNAYIYGKLDQFERVSFRCFVEQSLNGAISVGETETETVSVYNGYGEDVTNQFTKFTVTRDSGDAASDAAWNAQHTNVGNPFSISSSDLGIDGIHRLSTQFYVTATDEATETITPAAILDFAA